KNPLVLYRPRIRFRIIQDPGEEDMAEIRPLEGHCQLCILAERMADCIEFGPAIEVDGFDDERISIPFADGIPEPCWRVPIAMRAPIGRNDREHRALLKKKRNVLVVLNDLHGMRRERSYPAKRHAASRIVAVLRDIVALPLLLSPFCEWKHRLALVARAISICERLRDVRGVGPRPRSPEIRLSIGEMRSWAVQVYFTFRSRTD